MMIGIVTGYESKTGDISITTSVSQVQIPIPSNTEVNRCVFSIDDTTYVYKAWIYVEGDADGRYPYEGTSKTTVKTEHIDQSTGIIHFPQKTLGKTKITGEGYTWSRDYSFTIRYTIKIYD